MKILKKAMRTQTGNKPKKGTFVSGIEAILFILQQLEAISVAMTKEEILAQADEVCEESLSAEKYGETIGKQRLNYLIKEKYVRKKKEGLALRKKGKEYRFEAKTRPDDIGSISYDWGLDNAKIWLCIDDRERSNLLHVSKLAQEMGIPHFTYRLPTGLGDYAFFHVQGSKQYWIPILIERKAKDLRNCIHDKK